MSVVFFLEHPPPAPTSTVIAEQVHVAEIGDEGVKNLKRVLLHGLKRGNRIYVPRASLRFKKSLNLSINPSIFYQVYFEPIEALHVPYCYD